MGRTIRLFTTQNLEQKMEPCSEEKCHLPRYIKLVLKWGDSDVGEGVEIFFHQPPSILVSDWSAPPHLLVCKNPAMSLIGQLQFVIITVCACAHSTLLPSKNLYVLHTCTVYAIVLRTCTVYAIE